MGQQVLAGGGSLAAMEAESAHLTQFRDLQRPLILERTAGGSSDPASALDLLDAIRWCERIGHHAWRICHHLNRAGSNPGG
jgi:phosphate:Na+ symporter